MSRLFEKISFNEFKKSIKDDKSIYKEYSLPKRATKYSAGYDFYAIEGFTIKPNEIVKIPTGYKARFNGDEVLLIVIRSSMGFKYNVRMCNQVGVIDSDYYDNNSNEGHIYIVLQNQGIEDYVVEKGQAYAQGIFTKYLTVDNDKENDTRCGGLGSTIKEDN